MKRGSGVVKINGVAIGEVSVNLLGPSIQLSGTYALVNVDSGDRFGRGTKEGDWSKATMDHFLAFLGSMESDICTAVFDEGSEPVEPVLVPTDGNGVPSL